MFLTRFQKKGAFLAPFFYWYLLLILLFSISCQVFNTLPVNNEISNNTSTIYGTVKKVIDGDSIELTDGEKIRYKGINAPERNQYLYQEALMLNLSLIKDKQVRIEVDQETKDQYGRTLGYIFIDQTLVNAELLKQGLAILYGESKIEKYKQLLISSMDQARQNHRGLWQKSTYSLVIDQINSNAPGDDTSNINGEYAVIKNLGKKPVQLSRFILKDESNNEYIFPSVSIPGNSQIKIMSGKGKNNPQNLYWGNDHPIWNNDFDAAYLFDSDHKLVDWKKYP